MRKITLPATDIPKIDALVGKLNHPVMENRLQALRDLKAKIDEGKIPVPTTAKDVNNHIHTTYSFSPYSPTKAVWMAYTAGLSTAGLMDHDSIAGAEEFLVAAQILNLPVTIGAECRASFHQTALAGKTFNNPDQKSIAYVALHGIPHTEIIALTAFFEPIRQSRFKRNQKMVDKINQIIAIPQLKLDYELDILPLSAYSQGGQATERHLLYGLALKICQNFPDPQALCDFLKTTLNLQLKPNVLGMLQDLANPHQTYDLLNILKSDLVSQFYVEADEVECPPIKVVQEFCQAHGIILAYAYLGDVTASVTGDKKAQAFEDSYLEELFPLLQELNFQAVTYMPSRNSESQIIRLQTLCEKFDFFQISGEDINQPRQVFICEAMRAPLFSNLYEAAWALIGHEILASQSLAQGMFSPENKKAYPLLTHRIPVFARRGLESWSQSFVASYHQIIKDFVWLSHAAGKRSDFVQGGGGNTSCKVSAKEMLIKASGYRLDQIQTNQAYAVLDYPSIQNFYHNNTLESLADVEKEGSQVTKDAILNQKELEIVRPSVEAGFHAILDTFVLHSHAIYSNLVCCAEEGPEIAAAIMKQLDMSYGFVPYINPGAELTFAIQEVRTKVKPTPQVIFMGNHGLIVTHDDAKTCVQIHDIVNQKCAQYFDSSYQAWPNITIESLIASADSTANPCWQSSTPWLQEQLKTQPWNLEEFTVDALYPDQLVFLAGQLEVVEEQELQSYLTLKSTPTPAEKTGNISPTEEKSSPKACTIFRQTGEVLYHCPYNQALTIEQTLAALFYIRQNIVKKQKTIKIMNKSGQDFIKNWESEKYRQSVAKKE